VYAKNKRQQVVLCEKLAEAYPDVFFASMHPGWVDTNAVRSAMPGFYSWMKRTLRTPEEGADTVVWLCAADRAAEEKSGSFFQG
jgi:dehydrogenase/reductase SDR family protein 12